VEIKSKAKALPYKKIPTKSPFCKRGNKMGDLKSILVFSDVKYREKRNWKNPPWSSFSKVGNEDPNSTIF
jgi:hypothetical protein